MRTVFAGLLGARASTTSMILSRRLERQTYGSSLGVRLTSTGSCSFGTATNGSGIWPRCSTSASPSGCRNLILTARNSTVSTPLTAMSHRAGCCGDIFAKEPWRFPILKSRSPTRPPYSTSQTFFLIGPRVSSALAHAGRVRSGNIGRARIHNDNEGVVRSYLAARWLHRLRM